MSIVSSFSGSDRLIYLVAPSNGLLEFNAADLFSEIVVWRNGGTTPNQNDKWTKPVRAIGGDSKSGDRKVGSSVFMMNDWRLVPFSANQTIRILGDIGLDADTNTNKVLFAFDLVSSIYRVSVEYQSPNIIDIVNVSGGDRAALLSILATPLLTAADVWAYTPVRSLTTSSPSGSTGFPSSNLVPMHNLFNLLYIPESLPLTRSTLTVLPSGICEYSEVNVSGITWTVVTSPQMVKNTGYIVDNLVLTPLNLPFTNLITGNTVAIVDKGSGKFQINQSSGQQIRYGDKQTTVGVTGRLISSEPGSAIELIFLENSWIVAPGAIGNFDVI